MRILIIESEKEAADIIKVGYEEECFVAEIAQDCSEGLSMVRKNDYGVIVLGDVVPENQGAETCRQLREEGYQMPVIALSGRCKLKPKLDFFDAGADDYLCKPYCFHELLARTRAVLRRPKKIADEMIHIGDLSLDIKKHIVKICDKQIYLTRKEFMLLEFLVRNHGIVLSRTTILENVWDLNADPFSNTVEAHILNLRKKLGATYGRKIIKTIPGMGYKIDI